MKGSVTFPDNGSLATTR